jgi:hypothetical protein
MAYGMSDVHPKGWLATERAQFDTLAHELGHNMGLRHGGWDPENISNPDYRSLMNYKFSGKVDSYSGADDPIFNDWGYVRLDFQNSSIFLGNCYWQDFTILPSPEPTYSDFVRISRDFAEDVTSQIKITRGGFRYNRTTQRYAQQVTLQNVSSRHIGGPVSLVLDNLSSNAALFNRDGFTVFLSPILSPYINVNIGSDNILTPGESTTVVLEFTNPSNRGITYNTRVLAGPGLR